MNSACYQNGIGNGGSRGGNYTFLPRAGWIEAAVLPSAALVQPQNPPPNSRHFVSSVPLQRDGACPYGGNYFFGCVDFCLHIRFCTSYRKGLMRSELSEQLWACCYNLLVPSILPPSIITCISMRWFSLTMQSFVSNADSLAAGIGLCGINSVSSIL